MVAMTTACWCCGGPVAASALLAPLPFAACQYCGFAFREDRDDATVHEIYEGGEYADLSGETYLELLADRRRDARVRLGYIDEYASSGRLLDVGAAGGAFVLEATEAGFAAEGIEPTPAFAELAREQLGVPVRTATVASAELEPGSFHVVTLWHVLEHIPAPLAELQRLRDVLRPGGLLAMEVPNSGGSLARKLGRDWGSLQPDVHVGQFTPTALRALLERSGFRVLDLSTVTIAPYLSPRVRFAPRALAHRLRSSSLRSAHPTDHELLRAVAVNPSNAADG